MKAFRITSTEYQANLPSVFLFVEGKYYGCLNYPRVRKFPESVDYWREATCADDNRYFSVEEVGVTEEQLGEFARMHNEMDELRSLLKEYAGYRFNATKEESEADNRYNIEAAKFNRPIEKKIEEIWWEIRSIIKGLPCYEQAI